MTTPAEQLFANAASLFLSQMPSDLVAESRALIALDPSSQGIRVHYDDLTDTFALTWVGRWIGSLPGADGRAAARSVRPDLSQ